MTRKLHLIILLFTCFLTLCSGTRSFSQVSIVSKSVNSFLVTPEMMMKVGILNAAREQMVILEGRLLTSTGEELIHVSSYPFLLPQGMSNTSDLNLQFSASEFSASTQAEYIRIHHLLPSGKY